MSNKKARKVLTISIILIVITLIGVYLLWRLRPPKFVAYVISHPMAPWSDHWVSTGINIAEIDLKTYEVGEQRKIKKSDSGIMKIDLRRETLLIMNDKTYTLSVISLKDLSILREISLDSFIPEAEITSPDGKRIYINGFDLDAEGEEGLGLTLIMDGETYETIEITSHFPFFRHEKTAFSKDGKKLYMTWKKKKLKIVDTENYKTIDEIGYEGDIDVGAISRFDVGKQKILYAKTTKKQVGGKEKCSRIFYIYDLRTKRLSKSIITDIVGGERLSPDWNKMFFNEYTYVTAVNKLGEKIQERRYACKIHVFNIKTGKKITTIEVPNVSKGWLGPITPDGRKMFYRSPEFITVISLKNYSIISQVKAPPWLSTIILSKVM